MSSDDPEHGPPGSPPRSPQGSTPERDERQQALKANDAFYRAFASGDLGTMESLWARAEAVLCVHPGGPPLHGRELVMQSWRQILVQPPSIEHRDAQVEIVRGVAFVTCLEALGGHLLAATNVFVWEDGRWRMTHHQAGALAPAPPIRAPGSGTVH